MTFAIPPAQLKYARRLAPNEDEDEILKSGRAATIPAGFKHSESNEAERNDAEEIRANIDNAEDVEVKNNTAESLISTEFNSEVVRNIAETPKEIEVMNNNAEDNNLENDNAQAKSSDPGNVEGKRTLLRSYDAEAPSMANPSPAPSSQLSAIPSDIDDVVLASITTLQALEDKIVTIDGRLGKKVDGNAFKSIRVKRNNQDLGTLFEIREEWYVYKN